MTNQSLDFSPEQFQELLEKGSALILKQYQNLEQQKAYHDFPQSEVEAWFDQPLPKEGMDPDALLAEIEQKVLEPASNNLGPYFYAYVMSGGNQISTIAESLVSTINQNQTKWHLAPSLSEIEKRVIRWTAEMIGFTQKAGGVFLTGGSEANLVGLTVARNLYFEHQNIRQKGIFGMNPFVVYASDETHNCVDKSVQLLGIGMDQLRRIPTDDQCRIKLNDLVQQIEEDIQAGFKPFCLIGNAGTVNTGAIDDLDTLADIAVRYEMWYHVDGAYGGLASALDSVKGQYKGMERADSIALDFHKWLYQPFEAGCLLVRNWSNLRKAYFTKAAYLDTSLELEKSRVDFNEYHFHLSRRAKAFKVWMSLKAYGFDRIKAMIQKDIDLTHYLAEQIRTSSDFNWIAQAHLAIVCFEYTRGLTDTNQITQLNQKLVQRIEQDGRIFMVGTTLKGKFALRACLINHRMHQGTIDYMLQVLREIGQEIELD